MYTVTGVKSTVNRTQTKKKYQNQSASALLLLLLLLIPQRASKDEEQNMSTFSWFISSRCPFSPFA